MSDTEYDPKRALRRARLRRADPVETPFTYELRDAEPKDIPSVLEIYNHYVTHTVVTFDDEPMSLAQMRSRLEHTRKLGYPWLVAVSPSGQILGYASVFPWQQRAAFRRTVESSIYLGPAAVGKGLGTALLSELLDRARAAGIREVIAVIADQGAEASMVLHERLGFVPAGRMGRVGYKFDRWLGIVMLQKSLR